MNGVLVDTSVWVDHFRKRNDFLVNLLTLDLVLTHPMVATELACGTPPAPRLRTLSDIETLPSVRQATSSEVRSLLELHQLFGLGCGLVDMTLLASTLLTPGSRLWTHDHRLAILARRFNAEFFAVR